MPLDSVDLIGSHAHNCTNHMGPTL
jgi:hypothetical protein